MDDKKRVLAYIRMRASECFKIPRWNTPRSLLESRACHNWAVNEILKEIEESDKSPMSVTEAFIMQMDRYSCMNRNTSRLFSTAKDAGEWVLDILITLNERSSK